MNEDDDPHTYIHMGQPLAAHKTYECESESMRPKTACKMPLPTS